ncbi:hypothetical protein D0C36_21630 [Mucilaginibacter conchicola]|uniref:Ricin B lectin domain-containing protein n=1 Tax=Mucilaginibacter conchicola TaxID=2303333 RepID=A0A372NN68_9SPHI|nr:hypothetical protein [Mucilaginibacter conchicola]RFZ90396.1 hypothetical protein D0C36_21630 [Mucilaginibacter conchicola]
MKTLRITLWMALTLAISACSQMRSIGQSTSSTANALDNTAPLPTGTYFIVNGSSALTPWQPTVGQNVFLQSFNGSGTQKWDVTQNKTKKGISYTIKVAGSDNLYFQPFPVKDHTPMVGSPGNNSSYRIVAGPGPKQWYIKSLFYNGDAMHSFVFSPNLPTEIRFDAAQATDKFSWKFIPAGE